MGPPKSLFKSVSRAALAMLVMSVGSGALAQDENPNELQVPILGTHFDFL
jgi:hypothetical protein